MPTLVDSTQCHLWTDALHVRQLARDAANKWDRGTYVRLCVSMAWTAFEVACQEALNEPGIGYSFKDNLDKAISAAGLQPLDWSCGVWQRVRLLQEQRKSYVHKFASVADLFPEAGVADDAVSAAREAIRAIFKHASREMPEWAAIDHARGWQSSSTFGTAWGTAFHSGVRPEDENTVRVVVVVGVEERTVAVYPAGTDSQPEVQRILHTTHVPINGIRVYEGRELKHDLIVNMRGNA